MKTIIFVIFFAVLPVISFSQDFFDFTYGVSPVIFPASITRPVENDNQSVQLYGVNTFLLFEFNFSNFVSSSGGGSVMTSAHVTDLVATTILSQEVYQDTFVSFNKTTGWLNLIEFNVPIIKDGGSSVLSFSPGIRGEYTREERLDQIQFNWDSGTVFHVLASKLRSEYNSINPLVKCDLELRLSPVEISLGIKGSPVGISWKKLVKFSTTSFSTYQADVYNIEYYENGSPFLSMVVGGHGGIDLDAGDLGVLSIDVSGLYSLGTSNISGFIWNKEAGTRDDFEARETSDRSIAVKGDFFYYLTFIDLGDLIPMIHIAVEKKTLNIDGSQIGEMSYDRYDFGVAFRY